MSIEGMVQSRAGAVSIACRLAAAAEGDQQTPLVFLDQMMQVLQHLQLLCSLSDNTAYRNTAYRYSLEQHVPHVLVLASRVWPRVRGAFRPTALPMLASWRGILDHAQSAPKGQIHGAQPCGHCAMCIGHCAPPLPAAVQTAVPGLLSLSTFTSNLHLKPHSYPPFVSKCLGLAALECVTTSVYVLRVSEWRERANEYSTVPCFPAFCYTH